MRNSIHLNHRVSKLRPHATEPVLVCAPAPVAADLVSGLDVLRNVRYAPIARVALGFRRDQVGHSLAGFGVLVPARERFDILGVFFSSSLFPNRAPERHELMTVFVGGSRHPSITELSPEEITAIALRDVRRLLAVAGDPVFVDVEINSRAIPQYVPGFGEFKAAIAEAERSCPGLFLAGAWRDGVSVSDCIKAGIQSADRVAEYILNGKENRTAAGQHRVA